MSFNGKDKMQKDAAGTNGGGWIRLVDDVPITVTVLEYVGTASSKKYPDKIQYRFNVSEGGQVKKLDSNWRLMKALMEYIEQLDSSFEVTITQKKIIADITAADGTKSKKLVNDYTLANVKAVETEAAPF